MWFSREQSMFPLKPFEIFIDVTDTKYLKKEAYSKDPAPKNFTKNFEILKDSDLLIVTGCCCLPRY